MSDGRYYMTNRIKELLLITLLAAAFSGPTLSIANDSLPTFTLSPESTTEMRASFTKIDYQWPKLHKGVPPLYVENIPEDISHAVSTRIKKQTFFMALLPMVLMANEEVRKERAEAIDLLQRFTNKALNKLDIQRLTDIAKRYGLKNTPPSSKTFTVELLRRIDEIPPSLVLAQAANESAWGTSRFAQQAKNLFGEWTFIPGSGIVPKGRPDGATYEVRRFDSLHSSIRSYMNNLNSHRAYRYFRTIRADMRNKGIPFDGLKLAEGLQKYSERGQDYVRDIQAIISYNALSNVNKAFLRKSSDNLLAMSEFFSGRLQTN